MTSLALQECVRASSCYTDLFIKDVLLTYNDTSFFQGYYGVDVKTNILTKIIISHGYHEHVDMILAHVFMMRRPKSPCSVSSLADVTPRRGQTIAEAEVAWTCCTRSSRLTQSFR